VLILLAGLVIAVLGVLVIRQNRRLTRTGQRVTGTVTDLRWHSHSDQSSRGGYTTYHAVLAFRTLEGREVEAVTRNGSREIIARAGEQVPVIYDPRDPTRAEIDTPAGRAHWWPPLVAGGGLVLTVIGIYQLATGQG
jgi:hypothetical protein